MCCIHPLQTCLRVGLGRRHGAGASRRSIQLVRLVPIHFAISLLVICSFLIASMTFQDTHASKQELSLSSQSPAVRIPQKLIERNDHMSISHFATFNLLVPLHSEYKRS
jgi:hypothetical protein